MQGPDILVYENDSTEGDIGVHRTDTTEGEGAEGKERTQYFWSEKKYWILAIFAFSFLLIALILGVSLYFGLYNGKHESKGDSCKVLKVLKVYI